MGKDFELSANLPQWILCPNLVSALLVFWKQFYFKNDPQGQRNRETEGNNERLINPSIILITRVDFARDFQKVDQHPFLLNATGKSFSEALFYTTMWNSVKHTSLVFRYHTHILGLNNHVCRHYRLSRHIFDPRSSLGCSLRQQHK